MSEPRKHWSGWLWQCDHCQRWFSEKDMSWSMVLHTASLWQGHCPTCAAMAAILEG